MFSLLACLGISEGLSSIGMKHKTLLIGIPHIGRHDTWKNISCVVVLNVIYFIISCAECRGAGSLSHLRSTKEII